MCFINELRPSLNVQSDSLRAKVFKLDSIVVFLFCILYFILLSFFIVLNIVLHLTHIYANSINFFTYLKMTEDRWKRHFFIRNFSRGYTSETTHFHLGLLH